MTETQYQYLKPNEEAPYCSGCGHTMIVRALDQAFTKLAKKPTSINLVSDIGCVGLVDKLFLTNTIHTLHGRSTAVASGLQIADQILFNGDALHIVLIGDGGATIGLLHLVEAAKMNTNITVILHNNFVYGMTGGQNSGLTPENFRTSTTISGNLVPNIHIAKLLEAAHAGFIARKLATDKDLTDTLIQAMNYPGFSLVEVVELCTGYATKWNSLSKKDIEEILEHSDSGKRGVLLESKREDFGKNYLNKFPKQKNNQASNASKIDSSQTKSLDISFVFAGSAGSGVQFASRIFLEAALDQGLHVSQKNDNPVTIGTGYSLSEVIVSPTTILYSAIDLPDFLIISSLDGLKRSKTILEKILNTTDAQTKIIADKNLIEEFNSELLSKVLLVDCSKFDNKSKNFALLAKLCHLLGDDFNSQLIRDRLSSKGQAFSKSLEAFV